MKIAILGASGFLGQELVNYFRARDELVLPFSRDHKSDSYFWDPEKEEMDSILLESVDVVINLAGESLVGRWSQERMHAIRKSRLVATRFIVKVLSHCAVPPKLYIGASAIGYYGEFRKEALTEESPAGEGFLAELCKEWEGVCEPLQSKMRICFARFGMVLGGKGGALKKMLIPFKLGLGGKLGSGEQKMSWIAAIDVARAMEHLIVHEEIRGAVNFTAPYSVTNEEYTKMLAFLLQRAAWFTFPKFLLYLLFGRGATLFLSSLDVVPKRLLESHFTFACATLEVALKKYLIINEKIG